MNKKELDSWSAPEMRRKRYMQAIKVTMAYIQKNRDRLTPEEFYFQMDLVETLILHVDELNKQTNANQILCVANAS